MSDDDIEEMTQAEYDEMWREWRAAHPSENARKKRAARARKQARKQEAQEVRKKNPPSNLEARGRKDAARKQQGHRQQAWTASKWGGGNPVRPASGGLPSLGKRR